MVRRTVVRPYTNYFWMRMDFKDGKNAVPTYYAGFKREMNCSGQSPTSDQNNNINTSTALREAR